MNHEQMIAAIERAKAIRNIETESIETDSKQWNPQQQQAIDYARLGKSFCLIGSAGTGKTTTVKAIISTMLAEHKIPILKTGTKYLDADTPGVALISYTRRAVRNIALQMEHAMKRHCITFHKLVEYEPEFYEEWSDEQDAMVKKMRFSPARNRTNKLPRDLKLIIVDEASMLSVDYFNEVLDALDNPSQTQFIFIGDLNQLPAIYGQPILGKSLLSLPIVELKHVYRQALESPIISCALAVKDNNFNEFRHHAIKWGAEDDFDPKNIKQRISLDNPGRGILTLHPWKKVTSKEDGLLAMCSQLNLWIKDGSYKPNEDLVLCPWNKSFGTLEMNLSIADTLAKQVGAIVHEVIAGFNKFYFAVGDKLLIDKQEAIITRIEKNYRYLGKRPQQASATLNRWGNGGKAGSIFDDDVTDEQIDLLLSSAVEDRVAEASHAITVRYIDDDEEETITKAAVLNAATFAYAITVHKAQGSECRKVFLLLHDCHSAMCSRELIYTAITRASEELYIVMPPKLLSKAAAKPRIKGDTLQAKLEFLMSRNSEKEEMQ